ncbi:T9SS type A sorting domain-containing protein [Algibacter sp.]|nr:T9SS type A sorting domain-containing protein [Algibacter sp.]
MKINTLLILIVLSPITSIAQSIDFQEDTTVNNLYDSRQGSCAMADIDNDGDLDLIITGADAQLTNRKTTLYSNDGLGNFTEIIGTGLSNWSEGGKIAFADVDGDTDQDLLITGRDGSANYYVHFYLNDGSGNFTPDTTQPFEPSIGGNLEFADIDNDGDLDLFMTGRDNNNLIFSKLYQNDGTGGFSEMTSTPFLSEGGSASAFFDMDNDNDLDLILAGKNNSNQKKTTLYENDGAGNFSLVSNTPFENVDFAAIAIDDSDNDSDLDVLINGENDSGVPICQLYLNDGTGAFNLLVGTPFIQTALGTVDFADFDNDNDMDVLVTGSVGGQTFAAHIYENQGMNNFSLVDTLETLYLSSTALGDIDNDNDLDAIIIGIAQLSADIYKPRVYENMLTTLSTENTTENYRENILLYPNPSSGILNIRTNHTFTPSIKIYNLIGELVFSEDNLSPNSQITLNQPPGIYMIVIKTNRSTSTSKLIIK